MDRLQSQMRELVKVQGDATREFVEEKLKDFIVADNIDIAELEKTIQEIKAAIESDEDTFKLVRGIVDTNKSKLNSIEQSIKELQIVDSTISSTITTANRNSKECLRIVEEDLVLNASELADIYRNALFSNTVSEAL
jgi:hypothetical protein